MFHGFPKVLKDYDVIMLVPAYAFHFFVPIFQGVIKFRERWFVGAMVGHQNWEGEE